MQLVYLDVCLACLMVTTVMAEAFARPLAFGAS